MTDDQSQKTTTRADAAPELTSEQAVKKYLAANPDWLFAQSDLMEKLNLRAEVHGASSLLEHQTQTLRKTNQTINQKLDELNSIAESNQVLIESLLNLCLEFLAARSSVDLYNVLQHTLTELYNVEYTQLIVHEQPSTGNFRFIPPEEIDGDNRDHRLLGVTRSRCAQIGEDECRYIFGIADGKVNSAAIIPVRLGGRNLAVCCLGSEDPQRYHPGKDLIILDYISRMASATLERLDNS